MAPSGTDGNSPPKPPSTVRESVCLSAMATDEVMMSTTFDLPGYRIDRQVGMCWGVLVRSVGFAKGFTGGFKALQAGEVPQYTEVVNEARGQAVERLMQHARELGEGAHALHEALYAGDEALADRVKPTTA